VSLCICSLGRLIHGCPQHWPADGATPESTHAMLIRIITNQEKIMAAIDNLLAADVALKAEVTQVITDWQAALAAAGSTDPQVQSVANDMTGFVSQLQAADPATVVTPPVTPPAA
jgi:hypothetical protein